MVKAENYCVMFSTKSQRKCSCLMPNVVKYFVLLSIATTKTCFDILVKTEDYCVMLNIKTWWKCFYLMPKTEQYCKMLLWFHAVLSSFHIIHYRSFMQIPLDLTGHPLWILSSWKIIINILGEILQNSRFVTNSWFVGRNWKSMYIFIQIASMNWLRHSQSKMKYSSISFTLKISV